MKYVYVVVDSVTQIVDRVFASENKAREYVKHVRDLYDIDYSICIHEVE